MINIIFIDETLDNNPVFNKWLMCVNRSIFFDYEKVMVLPDSHILKHNEESIQKLRTYHLNLNTVLYITCFYGNVKCIRELCRYPIEIYHYTPNFSTNDIKNIMELYIPERKIDYKYCPERIY